MTQDPIYLDYHATTPVAQEVMEAMLPFFSKVFGNPASRSHAYGWQASEAVEVARRQVAGLLYTDPDRIFFTSGATEGLNMAIKGLADTRGHIGKHIVAVSTEHHAVLDPLQWLERKGYEVTLLPVSHGGLIDPEQFAAALRHDTLMAIVMWANNETGVIQPIEAIGEACTQAGVPLICDATQAVGKLEVDPVEAGVAILCLSGHKMYAPKGIGAMYIDRKKLRILPGALLHGGGHEQGLRSGTLNVPGIVGMGAAAEMMARDRDTGMQRIGEWRDRFERHIIDTLEEVYVNGNTDHRLPTVSNLMVRFTDSQSVISRFRTRLAISSGSACSSADPQPSHVLLAMGLSAAQAKASFRISLGIPTTEEEIERASSLFVEAIEVERSLSPVWQMYKQGMDVSEW